MRLQRVEMAGYKSFGARTELRFDAPVTAIVGPNGSGKSNVVDALRWVIGESANRNLRVRRLDDVIFSGGRSRAPSGFAEVRIALDNSARWLDLDAAEVEVMRRVHRDGESEFRINGRNVRMRDVQDLFRSAGLSTDGYAMIGQGAVDEMLRMRPADRRRLIEEVADVRRHRRRIDDSRRQRRRAADHLAQARVVRDELAPRVRSLARRAQRARQYDELMAELGDALRAYYRVQDAALRGELGQRRDDAARTADARRSAETGASAGRRNLEAADAAAAAARREADDAARERTAAERALGELRNQQRLDAREIEWRTRERRDAAAELESLPPAAGDPRAALHAAEQDLAEADADLARARAALRRAEETAAAASRARFEMPPLRAELRDVTARRASEREAAEDLARARAAAAGASTLAEAALDAATADRDARQAAAAAARAAASETAERRRALDARRGDLEQRIAEIAAIDAGADPSELRALLGVAPEWQAAIDAALGELQAAEISETLAAALSGAADAVERDAGRRFFIAPALRSTALADGERSAAQLIDAPDGLRGAVDALLGDVAVAETADAAVEAVRAGARMAVTREGLAVRADGAVAGGRGAPGARRRERQAAAWRGEADEAARELAALPPDRQLAAESAQTAEAARAAESAREAAAAQLAGARRTEREVADRAAESASALRGLDADARRIGGHLLRAHEAIAAAGAAGEGGGAGIGELERRRDDASAALSAARATLESSDRRRRVEGRIAEAEGRLSQLEAASGARARAIDRAESDIAAIAGPDALARLVAEAESAQREARRALDAAQQEQVAAERAAADAESRAREAAAALSRLAQDAEADGIRLAELRAADDADAGEDAEPGQLRAEVQRLRDRIHRLGAVDSSAAEEHREEQERLEHLEAEIADLEATERKLAEAEADLERVMRTRFEAAFRDVNEAFARNFRVMFRGGTAQLSLDRAADGEEGGDSEPDDLPEPGIVIDAQPPGKRLAGLSLLSGGERALTAIALLFALLEMRPSPFCVLDEVDAALDEANVERFIRAVKDRAGATQFIVITHNRRTIEQADAIYGVTMGAEAYSRIVSVRLTGEASAGASANGSAAALGNGARPAQPAGRAG